MTEDDAAHDSGAARPLSLPPDAAVDLHLHTLASDGFWTPETLIDHLARGGFRVVAVCDHDTQRSVLDTVRLGARRGIVVVPGVEVTTRWNNRQWHLLVYGISPDRTDEDAQPFLTLMRQIDLELQENAAHAARLLEASGRPLPSLDSIRNGRPLWPFHVLSSAIQEKHVPNLKEAAELVNALGGSFTADLPLEAVVDAAHRAGGLCVMAHPGRADAVGIMTEEDLDAMLPDIPIDGLEAHYRSYTDTQTAFYRSMAEQRGLLISCGSDSHAPQMPVDPRPWRAAWCADLLERLGIAVATVEAETAVWSEGMDPLAAQPGPQPEQQEPPGEVVMETEAELEAAEMGKE